jgi:uridine phosphorylase
MDKPCLKANNMRRFAMLPPANAPLPKLKPGGISPGPDPCLKEAGLISPVREAHETAVPARVILTFTRPDYLLLCRLTQADSQPWDLWGCQVRRGAWQEQPLAVAAPAMGAPFAAMVLEKLIALGARMVLALAWCGSLQPGLSLGTLLLPRAALPGDGTSRHYAPGEPEPDAALAALLQEELEAGPVAWQAGRVLSIDAIFRETPSLVRHYQDLGVLGIEMELAALFAVGRYRRVPVAALAVVSDELGDLTFRPGYRLPQFRQAREAAVQIILAAAARWDAGHA